MLLIFVEDRDGGVLFPPFLDNDEVSSLTKLTDHWNFDELPSCLKGEYSTSLHVPDTIPNLFCWLQDGTDRVLPFFGKWRGHSITKRSGVYGSTIAEADTVALLEMDDDGQLVQVYVAICLY